MESDPLAPNAGRRKFEQVDDDDYRGKHIPPPPANMDKRERSCYLFADPKMRELNHYVRSHRHEGRLRNAADLDPRPQVDSPKGGVAPSPASVPSSPNANDDEEKPGKTKKCALRTEGRDVVDAHMKRLAAQTPTIPTMGSNGDLSGVRRSLGQERSGSGDWSPAEIEAKKAMLRRMDRFQTRLGWRNHMDHNLRRLLVDIELSRDERLKAAAHNLRCDHLDKVFGWYVEHGKKETRKEKEAPAYVRYKEDDPVMAGSMRVSRRQLQGGAASRSGLGASKSSPALLAGGADVTGTPAPSGEATPVRRPSLAE